MRTRSTLTALVALLALSLLPTTAFADTMYELTKQGRANIGIGGSMNFTTVRNELIDGGEATNRTSLLLIQPKFGFFLADSVELVAQAGLLRRSLQRDASSNSTETAGVFDLGVHFNAAVSEDLAIVPGVGVGFYTGGSSRDIPTMNDMGETIVVEESTSTLGLDTYALFHINYRLASRLYLNVGVTFHFLFGRESIDSIEENLTISTANTSLATGIAFTF